MPPSITTNNNCSLANYIISKNGADGTIALCASFGTTGNSNSKRNIKRQVSPPQSPQTAFFILSQICIHFQYLVGGFNPLKNRKVNADHHHRKTLKPKHTYKNSYSFIIYIYIIYIKPNYFKSPAQDLSIISNFKIFGHQKQITSTTSFQLSTFTTTIQISNFTRNVTRNFNII